MKSLLTLKIRFLLLALIVGSSFTFSRATRIELGALANPLFRDSLHWEVYVSQDGRWNVTSTIIYGKTESILVDAQYLKSDAARLANRIDATHTKLKAIIITHPHEDHYLGLETLHQRFPETPIYISASGLEVFKVSARGEIEAIRKSHPNEAPESLPGPEVTPSTNLLIDGTAVQITEGHGDEPKSTNSYVWIPSLKTLITGDIVYNNLHIWLGNSRVESRVNWLKSLEELASLHPRTVIAGHKKIGAPDTVQAITFTANYIRDYEATLKTTTNADEFIATMKAKYPDAAQDWILGLTAQRAFRKKT